MGIFLAWIPDGGSYQTMNFDVVESIGIVLTTTITEHAVERGANVADHAQSDLDHITLSVYVSNTPLIGDVQSDGAISEVPIYILPSIGGKKLDAPAYRAPLSPTPGAAFSAIGGALRSGIDSLLGVNHDTVAQVLGGAGVAPTIEQTSLAVQVQTFSGVRSPAKDALLALRALRDAAQLITCVSDEGSFDSLLIEQVDLTRGTSEGDGVAIKITLRQIRIVESRSVAVPLPVRAKDKVSAGQKGADTSTKKVSLAKAGLAKAGPALQSLASALGLL